MPKLAIIVGSEKDIPKIDDCIKTLKEFEIDFELKILSAHRTPDETAEFVKNAKSRGIELFICGAGLSAHLPGVVASYTTAPVIGIPFEVKLHGIDSLLSIVNMPAGVPVATVGIDAAKNAAILAAEILSLKYPELSKKIEQKRQEAREKIITKNKELHI
ncbi:MAG: 5-(carboxyamino)imidazole ribonucleotide mutase [Elusimicrobiota bacterium]